MSTIDDALRQGETDKFYNAASRGNRVAQVLEAGDRAHWGNTAPVTLVKAAHIASQATERPEARTATVLDTLEYALGTRGHEIPSEQKPAALTVGLRALGNSAAPAVNPPGVNRRVAEAIVDILHGSYGTSMPSARERAAHAGTAIRHAHAAEGGSVGPVTAGAQLQFARELKIYAAADHKEAAASLKQIAHDWRDGAAEGRFLAQSAERALKLVSAEKRPGDRLVRAIHGLWERTVAPVSVASQSMTQAYTATARPAPAAAARRVALPGLSGMGKAIGVRPIVQPTPEAT